MYQHTYPFVFTWNYIIFYYFLIKFYNLDKKFKPKEGLVGTVDDMAS